MSDLSIAAKDIKARTIKGVLWAGLGQFSGQGVRYLFLLVLARLLGPSDFGLLGLGMIVLVILMRVGELGLGAALIQRKGLYPAYLSTAFWANLGANCLLGLAVAISAQSIAAFMNEPRAADVLLALAGLFPLQALLMVPRAMLERNLKFGQIAGSEVTGEIAFGVVGIALALANWGVWSLVGATIVRHIARCIVLWRAYPWWPSFSFDRPAFRDMAGFGIGVMGAALLDQVIANLDYFTVGRFLGTTALGYYTLAFQLAVLPAQRLTYVLSRVAFPSFSCLQSDIARLRHGFLQMMEYLLLALLPFALSLVTLSPLFIQTFYADRWTPTIVPMQVLALAGLFYGFDVAEAIYYAIGRPRLRAGLIAGRLALFAGFIAWFGLANGIIGIAWSASLSVALSSLVGTVIVMRLLGIPFTRLVRAVRWPLLGTLVMAAPVFSIAPVLIDRLPSAIRLGVLAVAIGLLYGGLLFLFYRDQVLAMAGRLLNGHRPGAKEPIS